LAAGYCSAQELTGSIGLLRSDEPRERTYGWLLSYGQDLRRHFAVSFSYQNEGHVPNHHRDGYAAQLWAKTSMLSPRLSLAIGAGPYRYFDTVRNDDGGYSDKHGWGLVYSATATVYAARSPWLYQLRADRVLLSHGIDTTRLTAGLGYRLQRDEPAEWKSAPRRSELTFFGGRTIVNSFESQTSSAYSVELRHAFGPILRGSLAWLDESDATLIHRKGVVVQGWLEPSFQKERLTFGVGYGPYIASDDARRDKNGAFGAGIVTLTASMRFAPAWVGRFSWNRVVSRYDRDTDVLLLGLGYRF
jgi:hypothetical protein